MEEMERRHWESMESEWEREKQKILNTLVGSSQDLLDFPQESEVKVAPKLAVKYFQQCGNTVRC